MNPRPSRRSFLQAALTVGATLAARRAFALGDRDRFAIAQVVYSGGNWQPRPTALRRLLWEIDKRSSIDVRLEPVEVRLTDPDLHRWPMLYLAGDSAFPPPPEPEVARLRRHLQAGGFLVIDGAEGHPGGGFDQSVRALAARLFPKEPLTRLPPENVIFKSFYLIHAPAGRVLAVPYLEGVIHDARTALCYCQNDLGGAWARDNFGQWEHEVHPGGDGQREHAFRLGVNLALYATCLDYKTDQVHVPFILRRRRWQP
ncbi:MAG: DUF4159 domain-containing protein [Myxococcales bacterium]|nr:DUF4159 domain-containing protein [Myxococcales bacterium]